MKAKWIRIVVLLLSAVSLPLMASAQDDAPAGEDVEVSSGDRVYQSYMAAPSGEGPFPGIVLVHSFRGLEQGYKDMVDQFAAEGFVVLAIGWQTFEQDPGDTVMKQIVEDSIAFLSAREDVDPERIGLTGFCAGGRHTMLYLPQIASIKAGVAWYGFPDNGEPAPIDLVADLSAPMLIIHGTEDEASPIAGIYNYATTLNEADKTFELKFYRGEPHGFMLQGGQLRTDEVAQSAFDEMVDFFSRKLAVATS
jgi:carboxymethylenebutenolidase